MEIINFLHFKVKIDINKHHVSTVIHCVPCGTELQLIIDF